MEAGTAEGVTEPGIAAFPRELPAAWPAAAPEQRYPLLDSSSRRSRAKTIASTASCSFRGRSTPEPTGGASERSVAARDRDSAGVQPPPVMGSSQASCWAQIER